MAQLPTNRSTDNTDLEHVADHNELHSLHNELESLDDLASTTIASGDLVLVEDVSDSNNKRKVTAQDIADLGAGGSDSAAIHDNVASEISVLTNVAAASGDFVLIEDLSDLNNKKRVTAQSIADLAAGAGSAFYDVKAYGAQGDDSTDDTTDIQDALNAAETAGGGIVYVPEGIYRVTSPLEVPSNVTFMGTGWGSELKALGITTGDRAIIVAKDNDAIGARVTNMQLNGNYASGGPCHGINWRMTGLDTNGPPISPDAINRFDHLLVVGCGTNTETYSGIYLQSASGHCRANKVLHCKLRDNDHSNVRISGSSDNVFHDVVGGPCDGDGFVIGGANNFFTDCKQFYADGDGFNITSARNHMTNCEAQDNGVHGFVIAGADFQGSGLYADSNGRLGTGHGFFISADNADIGLFCTNGSSTTQEYGIEFSTTPDYLNLYGAIAADMNTGFYTGSYGSNCVINVARDGTTPWNEPAAGGGGGTDVTVVSSTTYSVTAAGIYIVDTDTAGGNVTMTLALASSIEGAVTIKRLGSNEVFIDLSGSDTFDLASIDQKTLWEEYAAAAFASPGSGSTWHELGYYGVVTQA